MGISCTAASNTAYNVSLGKLDPMSIIAAVLVTHCDSGLIYFRADQVSEPLSAPKLIPLFSKVPFAG